MSSLKNKIQAHFNGASSSYDSVANAQREAGTYLVGKLENYPHFNPKTILDLGTGTGYISELLLKNYPNSSYFLNDIAIEMLQRCKEKFWQYPNMHYLHSDMQTLRREKSFDLIISNLAMQWVSNLWTTLEKFYTKSNDIFAFSTLLDGTFIEWKKLVHSYQNIKLHTYPEAIELIQFCDKLRGKNTFEYWTLDIPLCFDNPLAFMAHLKSLGALAAPASMEVGCLKGLVREQNGPLCVSYKLFFGIFTKD